MLAHLHIELETEPKLHYLVKRKFLKIWQNLSKVFHSQEVIVTELHNYQARSEKPIPAFDRYS